MGRKILLKTVGVGGVYAIPLAGGIFAFAQIAEGGDVAFFDVTSEQVLQPDDIATKKVAFRVPVANDAPSVGRWQLLGTATLQPALTRTSSYLHQPVGSPVAFAYSAGSERPASDDEIALLETLATWFPEHLVSRLEDHFAGRPNRFVESLKRPP